MNIGQRNETMNSYCPLTRYCSHIGGRFIRFLNFDEPVIVKERCTEPPLRDRPTLLSEDDKDSIDMGDLEHIFEYDVQEMRGRKLRRRELYMLLRNVSEWLIPGKEFSDPNCVSAILFRYYNFINDS